MLEKEILEKYSPPGLRKNSLDRFAKKDQLNGMKVLPVDRDEILEKLYGPENSTEVKP